MDAKSAGKREKATGRGLSRLRNPGLQLRLRRQRAARETKQDHPLPACYPEATPHWDRIQLPNLPSASPSNGEFDSSSYAHQRLTCLPEDCAPKRQSPSRLSDWNTQKIEWFGASSPNTGAAGPQRPTGKSPRLALLGATLGGQQTCRRENLNCKTFRQSRLE